MTVPVKRLLRIHVARPVWHDMADLAKSAN